MNINLKVDIDKLGEELKTTIRTMVINPDVSAQIDEVFKAKGEIDAAVARLNEITTEHLQGETPDFRGSIVGTGVRVVFSQTGKYKKVGKNVDEKFLKKRETTVLDEAAVEAYEEKEKKLPEGIEHAVPVASVRKDAPKKPKEAQNA